MPSTPKPYNRFRMREEKPRIAIHKLLAFKVGAEQYAIAIQQVQYILPEFIAQGTLQTGHSLVRHHQEVITLVDLANLFLDHRDAGDRHYLIVCQTQHQGRLGLPVAEMPVIVEVAADQLGDLPHLYQQKLGTKAVTHLIQGPQDTTLFYLDLERFAEGC